MNARTFLGDEKINGLKAQGLSDIQIRDYAKNEYLKSQNTVRPQNNSNLGIDGNAIPQAPTWSAPQAQDARDRTLLGWGDVASAINPFGGVDSVKAQDKIYDGIKREIGGILDYYQNDGKTGEELEKKNATKALARARHVSDDRTILAQLFGSDEKKQKIGQAAETMLYNWAKKSGYDDVKEYNGDYYLQKGDKFIPVDEPGIGDTFSTYLNEMGVPMGAITMVSALSPFKKLNMAQKAVAGLTTTAIGSGIGRAMDLNQNAGAIGADVGAEDYIKHALNAANDDLTAGLAVGGAVKGAKALYEPAKNLAGKAFEIAPTTPVLRQIATGNLSGAERRLNKVVGDELAGMDARSALDENTLKQFINNDRARELPTIENADTWIKQKYNEAASALNEKAVKPADQAIRKIVQGDNVNERRADLLLKALSDESGQGVNQIAAALKEDPTAYDKFTKSLLNLTGTQRNEIRGALKDTPEISKVLDEFSGRTKQEFRDMIDTLDNAFAIKLAPESEAIGALKNQIAQDLENPLIKNSAVKPQVLEYLSKPMGLKEWQEARTIINDEMSALSRYSDVQARYATQALKGVKGLIDEAMDGILDAAGKDANGWQAKTLLQTARKDYAKFKELEQSDLFKQIASGIKNDAKQAEILSRPDAIGNVNGLNTEKFLSRLGDKDRAAIESGLIKQIVEKYTDKSSKIEISDFRSIINEIDSLPLKTTQATQIKEMLNKNGGILRNTGELLQTLRKINPKAFEGSQGISPNVAARGETMAANRLLNMAIRAVPFLGDNRALKYNIAQAIKNSGDLKLISQKIGSIPTHNLPSETKKALDEFKRNLTGLSEVVEKTGTANKQEVKSEGWTMREGGVAKTDYAVKTDLAPNVRDLSKITVDEITADLEYLAGKHPEIFNRPSDVFRLIKEIKENPTHFFTNYRLDYALIVKRLKDDKIGKLAIDKQSGEVRHATKVRQRDLARMDRVSRQTAGTSTLPTPLSAADKTALKQDANSAGEAYSSATKRIIPQNSADRLVEKIIELDDAGEIGDMLQKTIISKDISTKTKLAVINAAKRRLVAIAANPTSTPDK